MDYYMRYIQTDEQPTTLDILRDALLEEDPSYSLDGSGRLCFSTAQCADVALRLPGDGHFERDVEQLAEPVRNTRNMNQERVLRVLEEARLIVSVCVLWEDRVPEQTLRWIDPLWRWLFSNRKGLVQADSEGYYLRTRCILRVD